MLCATCLSMFHKGSKRGLHHKDLQSLRLASQNGCRICLTIDKNIPQRTSLALEYRIKWGDSWRPHWAISFLEIFDGSPIPDRYNRWHELVYVHVCTASNVPEGYYKDVDSLLTDLETNPSTVQRDFSSIREIPDSTGHEAVAELARGWLNECTSHHKCDTVYETRETGWYPKRLVDVGRSDQPPRLVSRELDNLDGAYATLSHCWGENPDFFMLTAETLEDFKQEIPLDQIPASFRDAIITCRRLNMPYIWIDSLCILQSGIDAHEDWLYHSAEMHKIYLNCGLNIAIDVSSNPHQGAFRSRNPDFIQDCYVWTRFFKPLPRRERYARSTNSNEADGDSAAAGSDPEHEPQFFASDTTQLCAIFVLDDFAYARIDLPLSRRAWVLQEKLMSPRTLHFSTDRISWECEKRRTLSEYMPDSSAVTVGQGFDVLYQTDYNVASQEVRNWVGGFSYYNNFVFQYTDRQLSQPDGDKLVAFSAIAKRLASWIGGEYCAGVFREHMPWGLLWGIRVLRETSRSDTYRAPSWSWASLNARVLIVPHIGGDMTTMSEVQDVVVGLVDPENEFGQVKSASLTLRGPIVSTAKLLGEHLLASIRNGEPRPDGIKSVLDNSLHPSMDVVKGSENEEGEFWDWLGSHDDMFVLAIGENKSPPGFGSVTNTHGLLLEKMSDDTYGRVGYWEAAAGFVGHHAETSCEFETQTIIII